MTHLLKPHDFYLSLDHYLSKSITGDASKEELKYITSLLEKWDKIRFAETSQYAFARIRVLASTITDNDDYIDPMMTLIDSHVDACCKRLSKSYAKAIKGAVGIPQNTKDN